MTDLAYIGIVEASRRMRRGDFSPVELTEAMLDRIARLDPQLHAYVHVAADHAMTRAQAAAAQMAAGRWRGPLHGVPVALKDLIDTDFAPTAGGMPVHAGRRPQRSATVTARLEAAGAVILGKLAMSEGAFSTHPPGRPEPVNPWSADHWTGVSSSGSGVALAAGLAAATLGSDTGGSIRFPSACCGATGLKPTWGRVSRAGIMPLAETLDHVGPIARSAHDAAILLDVIAGPDPRDPTALPDRIATTAGLAAGATGLRIGIDEAALDGVAPEIVAAIAATADALEHEGARRVPVALPPLLEMVEVFMPLVAAEAHLAHRETIATSRDRYGEALAGIVAYGATIPGPDIAAIHIRRRAWTGRMEAALSDCDVVLLPVTDTVVPRLADMAAHATRAGGGRFTMPLNMTGQPSVTLPVGADVDGLPIGIQLVGRRLSEPLLLRAAHAFQRATDWHDRRPPLP